MGTGRHAAKAEITQAPADSSHEPWRFKGAFSIIVNMIQCPSRRVVASETAFAEAQRAMPGGVSSPVRAFKAVGGTPVFIRSASGCRVSDIDGNDYVDYVSSYGPMIAGHGHEQVRSALTDAIRQGWSYGAPTELETRLASAVIAAMPSVEMVRFVNSGTEATMSAIRLARAATGRDLVVKCIGCYHGHVDSLLVQAGSGALTLGSPSSPGIPPAIAASTLLVHYNDLASTESLFAKYAGRIACIIVEPVPGNMGVILPRPGYLQGLRDLCTRDRSILIFDEVMTGFRVAFGGAQSLEKVKPDLTCLGKIIGGGLPVGAYGGRRDLMQMVSPSGNVYQAGTLSGNPLAMTAGLATLSLLSHPGTYEQLENAAATLARGLAKAADDAGVPIALNRLGSMLTPFFVRNQQDAVENYEQAIACHTQAYATFFHEMLDGGVYLPPSQFEAWFLGLAHTPEAIENTIAAARKAFSAVAANRANGH